MSHSYRTPPPSAMYSLCFRHFRLSSTFSDSPWLTPVYYLTSISIDPVTNLNPILANTDSAPLHTYLTTCPTARALVRRRVPCLPHASPLLPRRASAILSKISSVANRHHLMPHCRQPSVIPDRCRVPRISRTLSSSPTNVLLAFPLIRLRLSVDLRRSPSISRVKSSADSSSTFNMTPW